MDALYWLLLFIVLLVVEIITLGLTTIWFAGGALVGFFLSLAGVVPTVQWGSILCGVPGSSVCHAALGGPPF